MSLMAKYNKSRGNVFAGFNPVSAVTQPTAAKATSAATKPQRLKTWELSSMFHCSIVGTCLTTNELRQVLSKIGDVDTRTATDHMLHNRGVVAAGQRDVAGKLLNKALDRRHETVLKRFSKLKSIEEIRLAWSECVDQGDISGAYWAVMSHPVTNKELVRDVFGEVHMLSHLVGSSSRLDLARFRKLEIELENRGDKLARQEHRLREAALENDRLRRRVDELAERDRDHQQATLALDQQPRIEVSRSRSLEKTGALQVHADDLTAKLAATELKLKAAEKRSAAEAARNEALQRELVSLENLTLSQSSPTLAIVNSDRPLAAILYVGGRQSLYDHLKAVAESRHVELLLHDGGIEDSLSLLPGMVSKVTSAIFPVDCISHSAAGLVKRLCRQAGKSYVPLRSASLASFAAIIDDGPSSLAK